MATFSERMRELRKEKGISLEKLAEMMGTTKATLSRYENSKRIPNIEFVEELAKIFDVSVDYLLGRTDVRNPFIPDDYTQKYKVTKRDLLQYEDFIKHAGAFFMNDEVAEEDKEKLFKDISELFWKAKEINKEKYGKKKRNAK